MYDDDLTIAVMSRDDLEYAVALAAAEGWNPGLHDADAFYATDSAGFFIARLGDEPVGCVSAVAYPGGFGFIGMYIVHPEHRGKGYNRPLTAAALAHLAGHTIGVDGVFHMQANYRRFGFEFAYRNLRYEVAAVHGEPGSDVELVAASEIDFAELLGYDATCFPVAREAFLRAWLALPESLALAARVDGRLAGYGQIRRCRQGYKIGPLFADSPTAAEALYLGLSQYATAGEPVYLDVPECNAEAMALAARHGMREVFGTARMYAPTVPSIALARVYGVTTFELG